MNRTLFFLALLVAFFGLAACGGDDSDHNGSDGASADHDDGDGDQDAEGHDDHEDHGEKTDLGTQDAGPAKVSLGLYGAVKAGFEAIMDITIEDMQPEAVRVWIGIESAKGSMKSKLDGEDGDYHGHVDVPTKLPEGSAIWIELEAPDGARHRTSFSFDAS